MNDSFAQEIDRLHDAASRIVGTGEDVIELFAEHSFREHLTLSYGRRGTHGGPSELYDHEELAGASIRQPSAATFQVVESLDPAEFAAFTPAAQLPSTGPTRGTLDLPADHAAETSLEEKRHFLRDAADAALSLEPSLDDLDVSFQGVVRCVAIWASDIQPTVSATSHVGIRVSATKGGIGTHAVGGAPGGVGHFLQETPESLARSCITRLRALADRPTGREIAGEMPVILEGGWGGVWLHEAVGHLLEADTESPYREIGHQIGSPLVTIVDDGCWSGGRGSGEFDDEGMPAERTVLVEDGVLRGLMTDRKTARQKNLPRTANGRRQDFRHPPMPRMTNLMLDNGSSQASDLVKDVEFGLYVRMVGAGEVSPAEDHFQFDVMEGYLVERGEVTSPVAALRISGRPSEVLYRVRGVGDDFMLDPARGTCVKAGQAVPVSVGMPTVLIERLTVAPAPRNRMESRA